MNYRALSVGLISLSCWWMQCAPEDGRLPDDEIGYNYYPVRVGQTWTYDCDSILYQRSNGIKGDTIRCQIMESITDSSTDPDGHPFFLVEIFYRRNDTIPWELVDNSFITVSRTNIIRQDQGLDFIKMVFPVAKNKSWNGNIRISQENQVRLNGEYFKPFAYWNGKSYYYKDVLGELTINRITYKKALQVEEVDYTDDINRIYSTVTYAENIGPVYREFWLLSSDNPDPSAPWTEKADYGAIIIMTRTK